MSIVSYCRRPACTVGADENLRVAAQRMEKEGIGLLVVTEDERVVGLLTDRDLALHVLAGGRHPAVSRVGDAMSHPPVMIDAQDSLEDALTRMATGRVRRLPVMDGERIEGIVSSDDLVRLLAAEIGGLGEVLVAQLPAGASRAPSRGAPRGRDRRRAEHYRQDVVAVAAEAPVSAVASRMQDWAVGSVVVLGERERAIGLVTDRDLALRVVAAGLDPSRTSAGAVMSAPLISARASDPIEEVVARMRTSSVRRIPILQGARAVGMLTFDDLLVAFGGELAQVADCVAEEIRRARLRSYPARVRQELEDRIEETAARLRAVGDQTLRTLGRELDQVVERVASAIRGGGGARPQSAEVSVADLMCSDVRTCTPDDTLSEAARIMWERDCGCVPVVAADGSGLLVGMITDRDICMASYTSGARISEMAVKSAMATRVQTCHPDEALADAESVMRSAQVRRLPVVDEDGRLRGLLSLADIAAAAAGLRAAPGAVSSAEVGLLLEAICRPRSEPARS